MTQRHFAAGWLCALGLILLLVGLVSQSMTSAHTPLAATRQQADQGNASAQFARYDVNGRAVRQRRPRTQPGVSGRGHEYRELRTENSGRLRYALALPDGFERSNTYPVLLAFPPGPQTEPMVEAGFNRYWGDQASARGWIVVSPVAPDGRLFFRGGEALIPTLLDHMVSEFQIEGDRFHVAGSSNGGLSAFRVALEHPSRVQSLIVLPGGPPTEGEFATLGRLAGIPIRMFAGARDTEWVRLMQDTAERLEALEIAVETTTFPGEGHVPISLDGDPIMELLEGLRTVDITDLVGHSRSPRRQADHVQPSPGYPP